VSALWVVLALVAAQRLLELARARRNTRRLLARGGVEHGAAHYPLIVGLHAAWLVSLALAVPPDTLPRWPWLLLFFCLQPVRWWILASLGDRWTTRIVVVPGEPDVRRGPYRLLRHPNYWLVALEILALPLAFGAWRVALLFTLLNAALIWGVRIPAEERALRGAAGAPPPAAQRSRA
jgi:methyltransferase